MKNSEFRIPYINDRTEIHESKSFPIIQSPDAKILSLGSCFAQTMANKLSDYGFKKVWNELGTIYNPTSLKRWITGEIPLDGRRVLKRDDIFFHYDAPSSIWGKTKEDLLEKVAKMQNALHEALKEADVLLLTLGTSHVHFLNHDLDSIANNHKMPSADFSSRLLQLSEINSALKLINQWAQTHNPNLKIIATISPVRHTRISLETNTLSKALLRIALQEILDHKPQWRYFPAYEIMIDDLRDYKFYGADLVHPSKEAEDYIFAHYVNTFISEDAINEMNKYEAMKKLANHRPLIPFGKAYETWKKQVEQEK